LPNVASDPVIPRSPRPEPVSGRAGAPTELSGAFEGLLETASPELPRARPQRVSRNRNSEPTSAAPNPTKPAETSTPRHGEKGDVSETGQPTTQPAEAASANTETASALALEFAAAIGADAAECKATPETRVANTAVTTGEIADAGDPDISAATDGTTAASDAIVTAIASVPVPANTPAAAPALDPATVAAVELQAAPVIQAKAAPQAAADPIDKPAIADTAKAQAASDAAVEASVDETRPSDDSQKAAVLKSAGLSDTPEAKSPARSDRYAAPGQVTSEHQASTVRLADARLPREAAPPADVPAEPKAPAPQHPQAQASEHAALTARTAGSDARPELPATAAAPAQFNASAPPPFNLAAHIPAPLAMSPLAALHVDIAADNAVPVAGLAVEIVTRAHDGMRRFEIRLDPPELGRIDVRLDVDHGGKVTSRLIVERTETLDLLRRDAPQLERALQQAGLNTEGGLEFSLRDQKFTNREQAPRDGSPARLIVPDDEAAAAEAARRGYGRMVGLGGGVDIRV
jgi:flagellar hook-length control protein FliK